MMIDRKLFLAIASTTVVGLIGCSDEDTEKKSAQESQDSTVDEPTPSDNNLDVSQTAEVGEEVTYQSIREDGEFIVTVEGLERSESMTVDFQGYGDVMDGYSACLLLLMIEDVDVEIPGSFTTLANMRLEDSDGVTVNPLNSGFDYGEYASAPGGAFEISEGQKVRIAIPYQLPDGKTEYTVVIDGTRVPVSLVEGHRSLS